MRTTHSLPLLLTLLAASPAAAQEYALKLDRLPKAGSVIEVASTTEQTGELGPVLKARRAGVTGQFRTTAAIALQIKIDEVDAQGRTTRATYRILRCDVVTPPRGKTASYITGKEFQVSLADGKRMYLGSTGQANEKWVLEEPSAGMLDLAVPLVFFKGEPGLDAMFGAAEPQKPGAAWKAPPQTLAEGFAFLGASPQRAAGTTTLKKGRGKLLSVESRLELSGLKHALPQGYALAEDKFQAQWNTVIAAEAAGDESALPAEQAVVKYTALRGTSEGKQSTEWLRETGQARYKLVK